MALANKQTYLKGLVEGLKVLWPENRTHNLVFHGHSVPSGYFRTPQVDTLHAYPHQTLVALREKFPFSVINTIITAIGGENSEQGAARFEKDVLPHRPDLLFIDYGLNDGGIGLKKAEQSWSKMIEAALMKKIKIILLTPTLANTVLLPKYTGCPLYPHVKLIEKLAGEYGLGLADSFHASTRYCISQKLSVNALLSQSNHPNRKGHEIVAREILEWFVMD